MTTLTQNELTQVAGGKGPKGYGAYGYAGANGFEYGTSGGYVYDQYYRESLSFDYHTYGNQYGADYGYYGYPHHGCGYGCGY